MFDIETSKPTRYWAGVILLGLSIFALAWLSTRPLSIESPYPPSSVISDVVFDFDSWHVTNRGSDLWPITWATDDYQYTTWGDGGGFGGDNSLGRVESGVARVEGDYNNYTGKNVYGGHEAEVPGYSYKGWATGILSVNGVLYTLANEVHDNNDHWWEAGIVYSQDSARSWIFAGWDFDASFPRAFAQGTFLQAGMDYKDAESNFVYIVAQEDRSSEFWGRTNGIDLARVPGKEITNRDSYEFFAGLDSNGNAVWDRGISNKRPMFEWAGRISNIVSIAYNRALKRYLLYFPPHGPDYGGGLAIFDAPTPWGPWTTVKILDDLDGRSDTWSYHFSPKWWRNDGKDFTLVLTPKDAWATVNGSLVLSNGLNSDRKQPSE